MKVLLACLLFCGFLTSTATAQYRFDVWNTDSGLPQNSIRAILQTRDGYLWLTTLDGLVRHDGVRFTVFNTASSVGVTSNRFLALFEDRDGILWIGTEDGGLLRYHAGRFTAFTTSHGLLHNRVTAIQDDVEGNLLVSTGAGLVRRQNETFVPLIRKEPGPYPDADYRDRSGAIWYFDRAHLYRLKDDQVRPYEIEGDLARVISTSICEDRHGSLWIGTYSGLNRLKDGTRTVYTERDGLPKGYVQTIYEDRQGNLWLGSTEGGLSLFKDGRFITYNMAHGLSSNSVSAIHEDREGTLWVGTHDGGLNRLRKQVIRTLTREDGLAANNAYPIYEDRAGAIWIGTWDRGLNRYENGRVTHFSATDGLPGNLVLSLAQDREGRLWVGAIGGVSWFEDGRFHLANELIFPPSARVNAVWSIHEDRAGSLWLGTDRGLFRYRDGATTRYTTTDGLGNDEVKVIIEDRHGALWIGTYGGLTRYADGRFASYRRADGLASDRVRALYEDREGTIWVGTYDGGLSRFRDGRLISFTTAHGLFNNGVFQILEDDQANFWMCSNLGIYRVSRGQLNDFAGGKIPAITSIAYGKRDGLPNPECNGGSQPAGAKARDGTLWFPTQGGVAVIDPRDIQVNLQPPPVVIEQILLDRVPVGLRSPIDVAPRKESVEIHYTGLSFIKPEHITFRYQLEGLDQGWVDAGTRRTAYYSHIPPGEYTFTVIAANSDGVWNLEGQSVRIRVQPPFWRTWSFLSLAFAASTAAVLTGYRHRISTLQRAHAAQQALSQQLIASQELERTRIAGELHDGLGQSLVIIRNRALLGLKEPVQMEKALTQLEEISTSAAHAISEVREIAHALRPYQLDEFGLTKAIRFMLKKVSASSGIPFRAELDALDGTFSKEEEINVFRMVQESVNNIVKHSGATEAGVVITRDSSGVRITVQDNGRGFHAEETGADGVHTVGLGLTTISERARMIGGRHEIHSAPGRGTVLTIEVRLREAGHGR